MNDQDMDRLLERSFSGDPPSEAFRVRVLRDSTAALVPARRGRVWWRLVAFRAAAVLIPAASFLLGRYSVPQLATVPPVADAGDTVAVPSELVVWLDAARLFKQLGMDDRMSRAIDHASRLLPREAAPAGGAERPAFAAGSETIESQREDTAPGRMPDPHRPVESINRIMAQSLGGYTHAGENEKN